MGTLTRPHPRPLRRRLGVGGEGGSSLFAGSAVAQNEAAEFLELFHAPRPSSARAGAWRVQGPNAGSTATAQEFGAPRPTQGVLSGGLPVLGRPSGQACAFPAPRVHNNRGPAVPAPLPARPLPLRTSLRTERKPSGPVPHSPGVVSGKAAGLGSLANSSSQPTPARRAQAAAPYQARAPQPGPSSYRCAESPFISLQ